LRYSGDTIASMYLDLYRRIYNPAEKKQIKSPARV